MQESNYICSLSKILPVYYLSPGFLARLKIINQPRLELNTYPPTDPHSPLHFFRVPVFPYSRPPLNRPIFNPDTHTAIGNIFSSRSPPSVHRFATTEGVGRWYGRESLTWLALPIGREQRDWCGERESLRRSREDHTTTSMEPELTKEVHPMLISSLGRAASLLFVNFSS